MYSLANNINAMMLRKRRAASDPILAAFDAGEEFTHSTGLIADYRFLEGSGTTVADQTGTTGGINLSAPTSPNFTWQEWGGRTESGLIQTPTITGAKSMVMLYRVPADDAGAGFLISGGASSGTGIMSNFIDPSDSWQITHGAGLSNIPARPEGAPARGINTGGWKVVFRDNTTGYTSVFGLGGRHSTTTSRVARFDVAWFSAYDTVLTTTQKEQIYSDLRRVAVGKGQYLDYRDCPTQLDGILLWGQSNADGWALISGLSAGDQAADYSHIQIGLNGLTALPDKAVAEMVLGNNHNVQSPSTLFGPEVGIALSRSAPLVICKVAQGSAFLAPSSDPNVPSGFTFSSNESPVAFAFTSTYPAWIYQTCALREAGIGVRMNAFCWMQGEQDAEYTSTADLYQTELNDLVAAIKDYTGHNPKAIITRIYDQVTPTSAAALATVRAAQAAVVASLNAAAPGSAALIDTDDLTLSDTVHFDAAGMKLLGQRMAAEIT